MYPNASNHSRARSPFHACIPVYVARTSSRHDGRGYFAGRNAMCHRDAPSYAFVELRDFQGSRRGVRPETAVETGSPGFRVVARVTYSVALRTGNNYLDDERSSITFRMCVRCSVRTRGRREVISPKLGRTLVRSSPGNFALKACAPGHYYDSAKPDRSKLTVPPVRSKNNLCATVRHADAYTKKCFEGRFGDCKCSYSYNPWTTFTR